MAVNGATTRGTKARYLATVIARDLLIVGVFLVLLALPSLIGTEAWFAREVARVLPSGPGPTTTGNANVYQFDGELTFTPNSSVSVPVGSVAWSLTSSMTGMAIGPLRQVFTFSYVPTGSAKVTTGEIDALVASQGIPVGGLHPHFEGPETELVITSSDGLDNFWVIKLRPKQKVVLYPMRTLGTLRNLYPWILKAYYGTLGLYGVVGLVLIRTVRAMRRQERDQCVRCGYPRGTTRECTECGLMYSRPLVEAELVAS